MKKQLIPIDRGRPGYNPKDLIKLYIYGYMNKITSSRKLEQATQTNIEVMWLLRREDEDDTEIEEDTTVEKSVQIDLFTKLNKTYNKLLNSFDRIMDFFQIIVID